MTTTKTSRRLAAVAAALALAGIAAPAAHAASTGDLYVATTSAGTLTPTAHKGEYRLVLRDPAAQVSAFADRPARQTATESLKRFVADWSKEGFAADPPNAALVIDGARADHDVAVFEITHPRLTHSGALALRARRLASRPSGELAGFSRRADASVARSFGKASLFVDGGSQPTPSQIVVTGLPANQAANIQFDNNILHPPASVEQWTASSPGAINLADGDVFVLASPSAPLTGTLRTAIDGNVATVSGTATLPAGATATIQFGNGAPHTLPNGRFSIPVS